MSPNDHISLPPQSRQMSFTDPIVASIFADCEEKVQCLMILEAKALAAPNDARLTYESMRTLSIAEIDAKTRVGATPPHRAATTLNMLAGTMISVPTSRHYLAGAMGTPTPASCIAVQEFASGIDKLLATVPANAQWVPVTALAELAANLRKS